MPSKKANQIVHPIFKRSLDRTKPAGELEVFGDAQAGIEDVLRNFKRQGFIIEAVPLADALESTCEAAEKALWTALDITRAEDVTRASHRFYRSQSFAPVDSESDDAPVNHRRELPVKVEDEFPKLQELAKKIAEDISEFRSVVIRLQKLNKFEPYFENSDISPADMHLAQNLFNELFVKSDAETFSSLAGLTEFTSGRKSVLENGRPARVFERHYVLELIPLWIRLTGKEPRDRDQNFIELVETTYRVFAFDPEELDDEMAAKQKYGAVASLNWETQLQWAAREFRETSQFFQGGLLGDDPQKS